MNKTYYDIIGDIHGHLNELINLLEKLEYKTVNGVWSHPTRKAVFLGDFIDRGYDNLGVVKLVREMVEADHAHAILGNHEFNALAFHTPDPDDTSVYLRPHTANKIKQHKVYLNQIKDRNDEHLETLKWFKTLPLFLELEGIRIIHACWNLDAINVISGQLDEGNSITDDLLIKASRKGSAEYEAIEILLKGIEIQLPDGHSFLDKDDNERIKIRIKWWEKNLSTYKKIAMIDKETRKKLPNITVEQNGHEGYHDDIPVFIGHYWMKDDPRPLAYNIACIDYSVADNGKLCAYRWNGESELTSENFVLCD